MEQIKKEKRIIPFGSFESLSKVCEKFNCTIKEEPFVKTKEFEINDFFKKNLLEDFSDPKCFKNEYVICERIISPIISLLAKANNLPLWSHTHFDADINDDEKLSGEPDYLFALPTFEGSEYFTAPVICLGEAKKDNFTKGWGQVGAEMIAAQEKNENKEIPVYGLVSTGRFWEFVKLQGNLFTKDTNSIAAPKHLDEVCNSLSWLFCEARKNADKLAEIAKQKKER